MHDDRPETTIPPLLRDLILQVGNQNLTMVVVGARGDGPAMALLPDVARVDGRLVCVNAFPDVLQQAAAVKRDPDTVTAERMRRFARRNNCADYLTIVNGDAAGVGRLLAPGTVDVLFLASANSYAALREEYLAFVPALRPGGLVVGSGYEAPPAGADLAALLRASEPSGNPALARYVVTRFVGEFYPAAQVDGDVWVAEHGLGGDEVAELASRLRHGRELQLRAVRAERALFGAALRVAKEAPEPAQRIAMLEQLCNDVPEVLDVHLRLGGEYLDLGLCEEAIRVYARPMQNGRGNADLYGKIGNTYKTMGDVGRAETYLWASLRHDHTLLPSWLSLAMLYVEAGDKARAVDCVAQGLEVAPPELQAVSVLARMSLALDEPGLMATALNRVRRLDPEHELAARLAQRLGQPAALQPTPPIPPAPAPTPAQALNVNPPIHTT